MNENEFIDYEEIIFYADCVPYIVRVPKQKSRKEIIVAKIKSVISKLKKAIGIKENCE